MTHSDEALLVEQHRRIESGISGLVDGSGSRQEFTEAVRLLRRHIYVEETALFPAIDPDRGRWMALAQMKYEHGDMWPHIEHAVALLDTHADLEDLLPDADALLRLLREHDHKEEAAIYVVAERYAADASRPSLVSLFASNAMPPGWRCLRAPC